MYPDVTSLVVSGTKLFAGTNGGGVFLSTNTGSSWIAASTGLTSTYVVSLALSGTTLFAAVQGGGVFYSTNYGASWNSASAGLDPFVRCLAVSGSNIYAGVVGGGVWTRPLSELITSARQVNYVPAQFSLEQNYPNPFNPSTTITFSLPSTTYVVLRVFDALGREVSTLASEELPAGSYSRVWQAENVSSGMYFYRLQAGAFSATRKLTVLR